MDSLTYQELKERLGLEAGCIPQAQRCSSLQMNSLTKLLLFMVCAVSWLRELICVSTRHSLGMLCVKWYENNEVTWMNLPPLLIFKTFRCWALCHHKTHNLHKHTM